MRVYGWLRLTIKKTTDNRGLSCELRAASQAFLLVCYRPLALLLKNHSQNAALQLNRSWFIAVASMLMLRARWHR